MHTCWVSFRNILVLLFEFLKPTSGLTSPRVHVLSAPTGGYVHNGDVCMDIFLRQYTVASCIIASFSNRDYAFWH